MTGLALKQEARAEREGATSVAAILECQSVEIAIDQHDLAAPIGLDLFDDHPDGCRDFDGTAVRRPSPVASERITRVSVVVPPRIVQSHDSRLGGRWSNHALAPRRPFRLWRE